MSLQKGFDQGGHANGCVRVTLQLKTEPDKGVAKGAHGLVRLFCGRERQVRRVSGRFTARAAPREVPSVSCISTLRPNGPEREGFGLVC